MYFSEAGRRVAGEDYKRRLACLVAVFRVALILGAAYIFLADTAGSAYLGAFAGAVWGVADPGMGLRFDGEAIHYANCSEDYQCDDDFSVHFYVK